MRDLPIAFSCPMVRALLAGTKTQTRRVAPQPPVECSINYMLGNESWRPVDRRTPVRRTFEAWGGDLFKNKPEKAMCGSFEIVPRIQPRDRLYVREAWKTHAVYDDLSPSEMGGDEPIQYEADGAHQAWGYPAISKIGRFRQGMHMPRWASRLTLIVTEVRVQRLQEISEADAMAEGITKHGQYFGVADADWDTASAVSAVDAYSSLWDGLNADRAPWASNPWVVAYTFTVHYGNIDQMAQPDA